MSIQGFPNVHYKLHRNGDIIAHSGFGKGNSSSNGNKLKTYHIGMRNYRDIMGAAIEMFAQRKHSVKFLTFTTKKPIDHAIFNTLFSKFLENLAKNYKLNNYIWVAERQKRGAIHYHALFDVPYIAISDYVRIFNNAVADYTQRSNGTVQFSKKWGAVVRTPERAVRYISKYIASGHLKGREKLREHLKIDENQRFMARVYSMSYNLVKKPIDISPEDFEVLINTERHRRYTYEYCTVYRLKDYDKVAGFFREAPRIDEEVPEVVPQVFEIKPNLLFNVPIVHEH